MTHGRLPHTIVGALLLALVCSSASAKEGKDTGPDLPPTMQDITCVGFSVNGKEAVFRVIDEHIGTLFQVRSVKKNEIIASFPFEEGGEKRAWRKVKKAHKVDPEFADAPENTKKNVVMMSQVKGDKILIHMMRGEAIKPYLELPLHKNKKGQPAEAFVKQMVWDAKGKHAVVVYHQTTVGRMKWEGDFVHTFKFKLYRT
ncbi:MAG: hypothetical protein QF464_18445, partial [Myxococcota bacterium]|nr:hypothetical protein [Myxococcota bacterium]